ncbi:peptidase domain-containing ABC transporter [Verminephrobacter aporrectodeae]|uniref:peptidase domain-containing ABC transporter n=1 Tax=Verminephrobacter aporrectodeae TaxID=1110389 RepID=UPI00023753DF|nr:peptidase domain-containing ABC transporter [Verminephrobacter aporrectodeae]
MILQAEAAECGIACLAMILNFFGHGTDLAGVRNRLAVSLKGMNLAQLRDAAQTYSLSARPLRLELHELKDLKTPCILHWDMNHFVVLKKSFGQKFIIHDPAKGIITLSIKEISEHFTGVALELSPVADFEIRKEPKKIKLAQIFGQISGLPGKIVQIFFISLGIELCGLLSPLYVQWVVDHALLSGDKDLVTLLALGFSVVVLAQVFIAALRSWVVLNFSTDIIIQWSVNVFSHLLRLPQAWFEKRHLGDIVSRFDSIDTIQRTLTTNFIEAIIDGLMVVVTLTMMLLYSAWMTLVALFAVAFYAALRWLVYAPLRRSTEEQIVLSAKQQTTFLESARGIQAIKIFGGEGQRQTLWNNRVVDSANRQLRTQRFMIGYKLANGSLLGIELILSVWIGSRLVLANVFSIGMLFAYMSFKAVFASRISSLIDKIVDFKMLSIQGERLADIVLTEREVSAASRNARTPDDLTIEIRNLHYRYSKVDPFILRDLTVRIPQGASVAITGPSGCGKTTLAKLILGLLLPEEGCILLGGQDLQKMGIQNYRPFVNAVMQDDQLFSGSIAENIAFFAENVDEERVQDVARMACLHDDITRMNMGYGTLIGDMGTALSGGQKQRLLLARALYRKPLILILDEATSHLDIDLEKAINSAIKNLSITRIVIAHRAETIHSCDFNVHLPSCNKTDFSG